MTMFADNQVIMDRDLERLADRDDLLGHVDVVGRRLRVARGVVMHEDDRASAKFERPSHDFPGIDGRVIDRADALHFVGEQAIFLVKKQDTKFFVVEKSHHCPAIIDHRGKTRKRQTFFDRRFRQACRRRLDDLQFDDRGLAKPIDFAQTLGPCRNGFGKGAKSRNKGFGEWLDVTAGHGAKEDELKQLIFAQGIGAALAESFAQPLPVAEIMRRARVRFGHTPPGPAAA